MNITSIISNNYFQLINSSFKTELTASQKIIVTISSLILGGLALLMISKFLFSKGTKITKESALIHSSSSSKIPKVEDEIAANEIQEAVRGIFSFYKKPNNSFVKDGDRVYIQPDSNMPFEMVSSLYSMTLYKGFGINKKEHRPNLKKEKRRELCDIIYYTKREDQICYEKKSWHWFCNPFYSEARMLERKKQQCALMNKANKILKDHSKNWNYESYHFLTSSKDELYNFTSTEEDLLTTDAVILFYREATSF